MGQKRDALPVPRMPGAKSVQRSARPDTASSREMTRIMAKLGSMPQVLCWNCRKLTPFELERCKHCGSPFAGGTGGEYADGTPPPRSRRAPERTGSKKRTITEIFDELQRVHHEFAPSPPRERSAVFGDSASLYQCPACGRFVSEQSTECLCGARFAGFPKETFSCPECGSHVPSDSASCPVCRIGFEIEGVPSLGVYACPRCGTQVASDQIRCSCGAWFEE